jgi:hypothetical protein
VKPAQWGRESVALKLIKGIPCMAVHSTAKHCEGINCLCTCMKLQCMRTGFSDGDCVLRRRAHAFQATKCEAHHLCSGDTRTCARAPACKKLVTVLRVSVFGQGMDDVFNSLVWVMHTCGPCSHDALQHRFATYALNVPLLCRKEEVRPPSCF